jgi:hypothetical protein
MHTKYLVESLKRKNNLEDLRIDGMMMIKMHFKDMGWEGVDWIYLAQDRDW